MVSGEMIDQMIEMIKYKHPRYEQKAEYWAMCLSEYDVPDAWLKSKVSSYIMERDKPPCASHFKRECRAYVEASRVPEKKEKKELAEGYVMALTGWDALERQAVYSAKQIQDLHKLTKNLYILKSDLCTAVLGWIATDLLRQGKSLEYVYSTALEELKTLDKSMLSKRIKEIFGYDCVSMPTRQIDPFEALAAQEIRRKQDGLFF